MKTNKIDATIIVLLSVIAFLPGCGKEQKETGKQAEQATSESTPATAGSEVTGTVIESTGKSSGEAVESTAEPMVEKTTEAGESTAKQAVEKTTEAGESMVKQAVEKTTEASQDLMSKAETATTAAVATVKEPASKALDVVKTTSTQVRKIQQALLDAGFNPGPVDGMIGSKTMAALESFQKQKGLAVGQITKETLQALGVAE